MVWGLILVRVLLFRLGRYCHVLGVVLYSAPWFDLCYSSRGGHPSFVELVAQGSDAIF